MKNFIAVSCVREHFYVSLLERVLNNGDMFQAKRVYCCSIIMLWSNLPPDHHLMAHSHYRPQAPRRCPFQNVPEGTGSVPPALAGEAG